MADRKVKTGLVGAGHLGKIHLKCLQAVPELDLVGFFEKEEDVALQVSQETGIQAFSTLYELLNQVDAVDIVTPTSTHHDIAATAMQLGKHVFIEKPITSTVEQANALADLQKAHGVVVQVGHVERFNPAILALNGLDINPKFIEVHRLANFNPRGTDVSVVLDLMIHDLDIILSMVPSKVKRIMANGVCLVSTTPDIGNARIEWENGCVANVTASRMSFKNMRKMRLFQPDAYIGIDFLDRSAQIVTLHEGAEGHSGEHLNTFVLETATGKKTVKIQMPETKAVNAIELELQSFARAIINGTAPEVSLEDARAALVLAHDISSRIEKNLQEQLL
ncbi:MAG: Gfo/Idh/MocA family oxidoreductase [Saprospiraceae bacterium]|nr:Gfo/Idh/MocA family oxidoreductase [Saprospiraceae bacterium]